MARPRYVPVLDGLILHIGAEKTGTTSIQAFLDINRERLLEQGVIVPTSPGLLNHTLLAAYAADGQRDIARHLAASASGAEAVDAARESFARDLAREVQLARVGPATGRRIAILSAEHLQSRLRTAAEFDRLKSLLPPARSITILLYIRRQDLAEMSLYSTALKSGWDGNFDFSESDELGENYLFNYLASFRRWATAFCEHSIAVRIFHPSEFVAGDLLTDFCHAAGIRGPGSLPRPAIRNAGLDADGIALLLQFNRLLAAPTMSSDPPQAAVQAIRDALFARFSGATPALVDRDSARRFQSIFEQDNAELQAIALPNRRQPLFDEDFSMYPDTLEPLAVNHARLTEAVINELLMRA